MELVVAKKKKIVFPLRITVEMKSRLEDVSDKSNIKVSEIMRQFIESGLKAVEHQPEEQYHTYK